ncbi:phosphotransferase family protein [Phaeobacter sp. B1627]|uniref:phosphotransferase family protein n=1 Tax=Phaeobacter sp. B1627 TaxID=2583809 RepID=UPI00111A41C3|nr:phosphotransferase [Phaeobacter sp. B1627]TNJ39144.1 hypothetical protein FGE21_19180 [Phaeobacter sp. B1627]
MTDDLKIESIISDVGTSVISKEKLKGGFSHEAWLVRCSDERGVVVRFGDASSAIEAAVLSLAKTVVPVPNVLSFGDDFTVLSFVEGQTLEEVLVTHGPREDFKKLATQLGQMVAAIGSIQFERPGFFESDTLIPSSEDPWSQQLVTFCADQLASSDRFSSSESSAWMRLCEQNAEALEAVDLVSRFVHSDMNPKNIIVDRINNEWQIAALIDWEFAYSGCPFADVGNFFRFPSDYPAGFLAAFINGFELASPQLTDQWKRQARILDMFSLSALAAKPKGHKIGDKAEAIIRVWSANGIPPLAV